MEDVVQSRNEDRKRWVCETTRVSRQLMSRRWRHQRDGSDPHVTYFLRLICTDTISFGRLFRAQKQHVYVSVFFFFFCSGSRACGYGSVLVANQFDLPSHLRPIYCSLLICSMCDTYCHCTTLFHVLVSLYRQGERGTTTTNLLRCPFLDCVRVCLVKGARDALRQS